MSGRGADKRWIVDIEDSAGEFIREFRCEAYDEADAVEQASEACGTTEFPGDAVEIA